MVRQEAMLAVLAEYKVSHTLVDLTAPDRDRRDQVQFMQDRAKLRPGQTAASPPQIFNAGKYCGVSRSYSKH